MNLVQQNFLFIRALFSSLFFVLIFSLFSIFCTVSCGLPNVSTFVNETNPPFFLDSYSSNNTIFLKIRSFNKRNIRKFISGYNIYFGYLDEDEDILKRIIYLEGSKKLPSILESSKNDIDEIEISLSKISYSNKKPSPTEQKWVQDEFLRKYVSYFFIVAPHHQIFSSENPRFFLSCKETIEENLFDQTLSFHTPFIFENISFFLLENGLIGGGETFIQDLGFSPDFFSIRKAPTKGYLKVPIPIQKNHVYAYKNKENFGKIFVKFISPGKIIFDFSYQGKKGEHEI